VCGRYTSVTPAAALARFFDVDEVMADDLGARYNVAPSQQVYAVARRGPTTTLGSLRWGLVPSWADDPRIGSRLINARAESVAERPAFRQAFARRRCLVPADGFYEWQVGPAKAARQPWYIRHRDGRPLAFAGLWESWRPRGGASAAGDGDGGDRSQGRRIVSAAIVTTTANEALAGLHDRMPVVLAPSSWEAWLDPANDDLAALQRLLTPAPAAHFQCLAVRPLVNKVANEGPELLVPADVGTLVEDRA
jgi:putative SOS response-associated peptidase YedK